jgi:hypothetical protein
MDALTIVTIVWAAVLVVFLGLLAYKGQLTRYEEDQLFLDDNVDGGRMTQSEIVRKCRALTPYLRACGGMAGLLTFGVAGMYVWDAWVKLR